jgi:gas vesicle protein
MKCNNSILGFISGIAAGAVLGILFAPDKGSETRKKIKSKGNDLTDDVKSKLDGLASKFSKQVDSAKNKGEEILAEGKSTISQINESIVEKK